jgi:hypothetical protein
MKRPLSETLKIDADASAVIAAFRADPGGWLPEPASPVPERQARWRTYLWASGMGVMVSAAVGPPYSEHGVAWRLLRWDPHPRDEQSSPVGSAAPTFEGDIGIRLAAEGGVELVLRGEYQPPGGVVGGVADALGMHRVAVSTARQFLADVAQRLTAPGGAGAPAPRARQGRTRRVP